MKEGCEITATSFIAEAAVFVVEVEQLLPLDHRCGGVQEVIDGSEGPIVETQLDNRELQVVRSHLMQWFMISAVLSSIYKVRRIQCLLGSS